MSLLAELKQRRIWRVIVGYPGVIFVLLQVVEFFINNYDLDHRFLTMCIIAAIVLLPAAILWNWRHGEKGDQRFTAAELGVYAVSGLATIAAAGWYWTSTPVDMRRTAHVEELVRSVAVLPFENAGDDADVQYLCDGIAESLINWLATVPGVRVASKSAAFRFRENGDDPALLAESLGVDSVVRGRLERHGDDIVVSASLIDTRDEHQIWGERMVQPANKVLYLERSIVEAIKAGLRLKVSDVAPVQSAAGGTENPDAYQHYLRGHFLIQATNLASIEQGLDELRTAISLDPKFALPYADFADAMLQMLMYGIYGDESLKGEARNAAYTAVALAPELPEAHTALAMMHQTITFDWRAADDAYDTAISLSPQSPAPYYRYADYLWATLRFERSNEMATRALEIDPRNSNAMHALGIGFLYAGDFDAAAITFEDWSRFYPGSRWSYIKLALALALSGQCEVAAEPAATAERLLQGKGSPMEAAWLAWGYQVCGRDDLFARSIMRLEGFHEADPNSIDPGLIFYHLLEGDLEAAIEKIRKTIETRNPWTLFVQLYMLDHFEGPASQALKDDSRFRNLVKGLDFPATAWSVTD